MTDTPLPLHQIIAERVSELRLTRGLTLDELAEGSGVSRSMISLIERGESSPTAVVLEKLATALGVVLASLFVLPEATPTDSGPVSRHASQPTWRDPASGYTRRHISPVNVPQPMQIVEVHFPARARVAFETATRDTRVQQQVWVLSGSIDITIGKQQHRLKQGDCLAMELDQPVMFHNPTRKAARYAVVIASEHQHRK